MRRGSEVSSGPAELSQERANLMAISRALLPRLNYGRTSPDHFLGYAGMCNVGAISHTEFLLVASTWQEAESRCNML
jgi:hypothetical protein